MYAWVRQQAAWVLWLGWLATGIAAPVLANKHPLLCFDGRTWHFPFLTMKGYEISPADAACTVRVWAPIRHSPGNSTEGVPHLLGAYRYQSDVLTDLIHGSRTALVVGIGSVSFSLLIGVSLGMLGGYVYQKPSVMGPGLLAGMLIGCIWGYAAFILPYRYEPGWISEWWPAWLVAVVLAGSLGAWVDSKLWRGMGLGVDKAVMTLIWAWEMLPKRLLLFSMGGWWLVKNKDASGIPLWMMVVLLGMLGWTSAARWVRAEMIRLNGLSWVWALKGLGIPPHRVFLKHFLPQIFPGLGALAVFGISHAILAEAALSFVGLGVAARVSWGEMLYIPSLLSFEQRPFWSWAGPALALFLVSYASHVLAARAQGALLPTASDLEIRYPFKHKRIDPYFPKHHP